MATKAPVKKSVAASKAKSVSKQRAAKTSSRGGQKSSSHGQNVWQRSPFLFYTALVTAALVALTLGLMTYQSKKDNTNNIASASDNTGVLFLQSLESKKAYTNGETLDVTLYEDSGKQKVNALQAAVKYPADKLQLVNVKGETSFSQEAATDVATAGLVRIARSIKAGEPAQQGAKPVVTLQFKVVADSPNGVELSIDDAASLLVRASDNSNILSQKAYNKYEL